jgi:hypothetical protein
MGIGFFDFLDDVVVSVLQKKDEVAIHLLLTQRAFIRGHGINLADSSEAS